MRFLFFVCSFVFLKCFLQHNSNYVVFPTRSGFFYCFLYQQTHIFHLFPMLCSAFDYIDTRCIYAAVAENIRQP